MHERHQPDKQFIDNLEWQIGGEIRRRNRAVDSTHPLWRLARVAVVVIVSMTLGAAAMGASYQIEDSWRRELVVSDLEIRLELARKRLELVGEEAAAIELRAGVGTASVEERAQMRMYLADGEAQVRLLELQLEEVLASGREPLGEVSSPVIRGRDFVAERLEVELDVARQMQELAQGELDRGRTRYEVGTSDIAQFESTQLAFAEYAQKVVSLERRLAIRADFVDGDVTGVAAELLVRIADTEARTEVANRRHSAMQRELERIRLRVDVGVEPPIIVSEYELALAEVEAELRLAELELEILRRELQREQER